MIYIRKEKFIYFPTQTNLGDNLRDNFYKSFLVDEKIERSTRSCEKCKKQDFENKFLEFHTYGNILIISLKRFGKNFIRIDKSIQYDHKLEIGNVSYTLYATIHHLGKTAKCGHYTANCLYDNQWYNLNDKSVKKIETDHNKKEDNKKTVYMLFFKKTV